MTLQKGTLFDARNQLVLKLWTEPVSNNVRVLVLWHLEPCSNVIKWNRL